MTTDSARTNIIDNYVLEGADVQNNNLDRLYIGNRSGGRNRAYVKFATMPTIPSGATISSATMTLHLTSGTNTGYSITAYKILADWDSDTIKWSNRPSASTLVASIIGHNNLTKYSFTCTSAVQSWYNGSTTGQNANYGIMLRYYDETVADYNAVYSADYSVESKRPSMTISYQLPAGAITGIHYIKCGAMYLSVNNGMIVGSTLTLQSLKPSGPARLRQLWRIEYSATNYYTIRSVYRPDLVLSVTNGVVSMASLGTSIGGANTPSSLRWKIMQGAGGYTFQCMGLSSLTLYPLSGAAGASVTVGTPAASWTLEFESVDNQLLLINTANGLPSTNAIRYITPGTHLSLSDMNFSIFYITQNSIVQYSDWESSDTHTAKANEDTGEVSGVWEGQATITATHPNSTNTVSYTLKVLAVPSGTYYIRNRQYGRYLQIDDEDAANDFESSGAIMEQWAYNGGSQQKWRITSLNNGYYSIISVKSGLALSVPAGKTGTTDVPLIQEAYQGLDRQKWKITTTGEDFHYKIKPKSAEGLSNDFVIAVSHLEESDVGGVEIEQRIYGVDSGPRGEWQICSFVDIGMSTDNYTGSPNHANVQSYRYATKFYNGLLNSMGGLPMTATHIYTKDSTHNASKEDFSVNGAISAEIDFMIYLGHGYKATDNRGNYIHYYCTPSGIPHTDGCTNEVYNVYTKSIKFGSSTSDLRWVWMYTCNFLTPNNYVSNESLTEMMNGIHILMGYESQSKLCDPMVERYSENLREGEPIISSFFKAGHYGEASATNDHHIQKVLYIQQAEYETIYSPQIHYEYDSSDVKILTRDIQTDY